MTAVITEKKILTEGVMTDGEGNVVANLQRAGVAAFKAVIAINGHECNVVIPLPLRTILEMSPTDEVALDLCLLQLAYRAEERANG
jgi:hypothetical protein